MSQIGKLAYVDAKLGAPTSGQQTTRVLFNTIENPGTTSVLNFFQSFQGLTNGQTNLTVNKLDSMESMVVKSIWFAQFAANGTAQLFNGSLHSTISVFIGNQQVVKDLPLVFNAGDNAQAFDRLHENGGTLSTNVAGTATNQVVQPVEIRLLTDIVLPPQVSFTVRVESAGTNFGDGAVVCALSGYGKIFSAGNSF
jgi:hypothetical protein